MADSRSNSVLFVLDELREIEDARVRDQRDRELQLEAERRAREDRLEAERRRLEAEREEVQRRREEQRAFELELAERRERIEAQMKLEERRIALELECAAARPAAVTRARWPWLVTTAAFALLAATQWMQWQVQQQIDRSLADVRAAQAAMTQPVYIDGPTPSAAVPEQPRTVAPTEPPAAPPRSTSQDGGRGRSAGGAAVSKPVAPVRGVAGCNDLDDPLACLPGGR